MLDPAIAGGGPTINVATHFFDLFRFMTSKEVSTVSAVMSSRTHGGEIDDYSIVTLQTDDGVVGVIESGYSFPSTPDEQREFFFTLGSSGHYAYDRVVAIDNATSIFGAARHPKSFVSLDNADRCSSTMLPIGREPTGLGRACASCAARRIG